MSAPDYLAAAPSFLQTAAWAEFWQEAMEEKHSYHLVEFENDTAKISAYLYQYPWHLNQCFLYLPKGPVWIQKQKSAPALMIKTLREFWYEVVQVASENECTYIKADFDEQIFGILGVEDNETLLELLETIQSPDGRKKFPKIELRGETKSIQYLQTMVLDTESVKTASPATYTVAALRKFYEDNPEFWARTNQNIRRYTKKTLKGDWEITVGSQESNFEDFWQVYQDTAKRQNFATHDRAYFAALAEKDFSHVITLGQEGEVQCVWFGVASGDTLTYLYGGNTESALKSKAQYLMHVAALRLLKDLGLRYYDLGGYDADKGFGKFKEGYRGEIRTFLGPVDVVLESRKYDFTNKFVGAAKSLTSWIR